MSGILQMLVAADSGVGPISFFGGDLSDSVTSGSAIAGLSWGTTGTLSKTGNASAIWVGSSAWFSPGSPSVTYYIKFTLLSGSAWDAGLVAGTVYSLASSRAVQWTQSVVGSKLASVRAEIYTDSGGTILVATEEFVCMVERA